jgi:hypothetical protein
MLRKHLKVLLVQLCHATGESYSTEIHGLLNELGEDVDQASQRFILPNYFLSYLFKVEETKWE